MAYSPDTVKDLIRLGGNIIISGKYSPDTLKDYVRLAITNNVKITIKADSYSPDTLKDLIRLGKDNLTLEI